MCEPSVIAGAATAAGGIVNRYEQGKRYKQAVQSSTIATRRNQAAINTRISEERQATAWRADAMGMEADKVRGQVEASAAAGGVQGLSIQELSGEVSAAEARNQAALEISLGWKEGQLMRESEAYGEQHVARSLQFMPTSTYGGAVLGGLGVGASLFLKGQTAQVESGTAGASPPPPPSPYWEDPNFVGPPPR